MNNMEVTEYWTENDGSIKTLKVVLGDAIERTIKYWNTRAESEEKGE